MTSEPDVLVPGLEFGANAGQVAAANIARHVNSSINGPRINGPPPPSGGPAYIDELTELRRRCAALAEENIGLRARLGPGEGEGAPSAWAAFAAEVRPENALTSAEVMECGKLFCQYLEEVNGLQHITPRCDDSSLSAAGDHVMRIFGGDEKAIQKNAWFNLVENQRNILVEGDLELLPERASHALGFPLFDSIMRKPRLDCHHDQHTLSFAMGTHPRLGDMWTPTARCHVKELPGDLVQRIVHLALAQPWGIFRQDVGFKDYLNLVARHLNAARNGEPNPKRDWILAKCNACKKWRRVPDWVDLEEGEDVECEFINRICRQPENSDEDKDERYWRRRWWKSNCDPVRRLEYGVFEEEEQERGVLVAKAQEPERIRDLLKRMFSVANLDLVSLEMCRGHIKALFDDGEAVCVEHEALIATTFEEALIATTFEEGISDSVDDETAAGVTAGDVTSNDETAAGDVTAPLEILISNEAIRRLMRQAQIARWSSSTRTKVREILSGYLDTLVSAAMIYCEHRRDSMIESSHVAMAVQLYPGRRLYDSYNDALWREFGLLGGEKTDFTHPGAILNWTQLENDHQGPGQFISTNKVLPPLVLRNGPWHPQTAALHEIREASSLTNLVIRSHPFRCLVEQIGQNYNPRIKFEPCAIHAFQEVAEEYIVRLLSDAHECALRGEFARALSARQAKVVEGCGFRPEMTKCVAGTLARQSLLLPADLLLARRVRGEISLTQHREHVYSAFSQSWQVD